MNGIFDTLFTALKTIVLGSGLPTDPTIKSGIGAPTAGAPEGSQYNREDPPDPDHVIYAMQNGAWWSVRATPPPVFMWDALTTWDVIYAAIVAASGYGIVLVKADGPKEMTPLPGGGSTDLSSLLFIGLLPPGAKPVHIHIDSLGVGGFSLGGNHNIQSKDVQWITYYQIGSGSEATWQFDGGGMESATVDDAYNAPFFNLILKNRANVNGTNCTNGLITGVTQGASAYLTTSSSLGPQVIHGMKGLPPYPTWGIERDASCTIDPNAFLNPAGGGTLIDGLSDKSQFVDPSKGDTASRPPFPGVLVGQQYFDTDLGKPIWWNGQWVDATGTPV